MSKNDRILRLCIPVLLVIGCIAMFFYIEASQSGLASDGMSPWDFPSVVLWLILVMSVIDIIKECIEIKKAGGFKGIKEKGKPILSKAALAAILSIIIYAVSFKHIGFSITTAIYVMLVGKVLRKERPWWLCAVIGVGFAALMYVLFVVVIRVNLPEPILNLILY